MKSISLILEDNYCFNTQWLIQVVDLSSTTLEKKSFTNTTKIENSNDIFPESCVKQKKKRKKGKENAVVPHIIYELEEDLDRELDIKAQRNNLTATNVKNMIKAVITDSEVIKMIDYTLDKSTERPVYELKLTRAKTKELVGLNQNAIWSMPSSQKKSDFEALINQELSEDSSDEEYEPHDDGSDEDTKANENTVDEESIIDDECSECDSSIKETICKDSKENESDENIWQRTRSKLSLSKTPLEEIEQGFIPPDITTDMYNTHCDNQDWLNFLKEFYFDSNQLENNDDENDPEYNVMVDEETEGTDMEELRMDRAVKVTKKELNELISELFEYTEMLSTDDEEESKDDSKIHPSKPENEIGLPDTSCCSTTPPNMIEVEEKTRVIEYFKFTEKQNFVLKQQLEQHVQLLLQSFLLAYKHPLLQASYAMECKKRIMELNVFSCTNSSFSILNLPSSLDLMNKWIEYLDVKENLKSLTRFMEDQLKKFEVLRKKRRRIYLPDLHPKLTEFCLSSFAFMYPLFLPNGGFTGSCLISKGFLTCENQLIAMGLEEFSDLLGLFPERNEDLRKIVEFVNHYLITTKPVSHIMLQIQKLRKSSLNNPIKEFFKKRKAPEVSHYVVVQTSLTKLNDYSKHNFPPSWEQYLLKNNSS